MRKLFILLAFALPYFSQAQNVGIGTDTPDPNALLDIFSNSKGVLLPRMTTAQRTAISGPTIGLTVFDTDTYSYWMYRGDVNGGWAEMQHNYQNTWTLAGSNIYNMNNGNVGIGTNNPQEKLSINATNPGIQFLNSNSAKGFIQVNSSDLKVGTYNTNTTGNLMFTTKGIDRMSINENGLVGIGTTTPVSALTINGTNPYIQIQNSGVNKGFLQTVNDDLRVGTNSTNTTGSLALQTKLLTRMTIDPNGLVGIGTTTPSSLLTLNAVDPILQLRNNNVDKGFLQLVGDDIKIGTNISNDFGNFIIRTNGADRLSVSSNGNVRIGTGGTFYKLEVDGQSRFADDMWIEGELNSADIQISKTNLSPTLSLQRTGALLTQASLQIDDNYNLKLGKSFNGGGIILDANTSTGTKRFYISKGNQFNFGTGIYATGYTLSVEGKVIATDFTTQSIGSWPDYVFDKNYQLPSLPELKQFISDNKHLPGIPAAAQVEKEGIQLGDMSKRLMEKVEELTLYILQLQEQIDELKKENNKKTNPAGNEK